MGGGVIGTSIAYHLVRQDADVTLVEAGDLASGSSGACDGLVFMQS
ncbi:MAG: FAD-binding oxidoreductase, partial [Desulfobacterales bacterium]|nr:FAD-binding oxidoreductase [Desulfobacterales bacterium]